MSDIDSDTDLDAADTQPAPTIGPVRFSRLKLIGRSPEHYLGFTVRQTQTIERGTATHALLLGGRRVVAFPGKQRRGKEWDAFREANLDAEILARSDYDKAHLMAESVARNSLAMSVLRGAHEQEISWKFQGRECAGRVDVIGDTFVTELKTGVTSDPNRFTWQSLRMAYHAQCAWYRNGAELAGLGKKRDVFVVAVENVAPFVCTVFQMTPRALEQGERMWRLWFERLMNCEQSKAWPGYCEAIVPLDVPEDEPELIFEGDEAA